jgi:hypothetical protein
VHLFIVKCRVTTKILVLSLLATAGLSGQDAREIVRRSMERDWTDFESRKDYLYQQRRELREYAKDGSVGSRRSETKELVVVSGRPFERLLARNDQPLPEKEARREQQRFDHEVGAWQRQSEADRAKVERERAEDRKFIRELPEAFVFRLLGVENVSGQPAWVIDAEPKPGYRPAHPRARMFTKVRAKVWIEQATYHWVKMDAEALDTLTFGFGLLRIAPGGTLHFEQVRVNSEIWLPSRVLIHADARLALIKKLRAEIDIRYSDYRKFQSDSQILEAREN